MLISSIGNLNPVRTGILLVLSFLILANANAVFSSNLLQQINPFIFLFWSFLITSLFFIARLIIATGDIKSVLIPRFVLMDVLLVNFTTALNWIGYYVALKFIEPAIVCAILGGLGPICIIVIEIFLKKRRLSQSEYFVAIGILLGTLLLASASLMNMSSLNNISLISSILGLAAAVVGGISQATTVITVKQLGQKGWTATQIMAHRFYLLIFIAAIFAHSGPGLSIHSSNMISYVIIATLIGVVIPLWLLQKGIILSDPFTVSALLSFAPIITYFFQIFDARLHWSLVSAIGCLIVTGFTLYITQLKYRNVRSSP